MSGPWAEFGRRDQPGQDPYGETGYGQGPYGETVYGQGQYSQQQYGPAAYGHQNPNPTQQLPYDQYPGAAPYGFVPYAAGAYPPDPYGPANYGQQAHGPAAYAPAYGPPGYGQPYVSPPYGQPAPPAGLPTPGKSGARTFAVIAAAVVVIAIAVTATLILLNSKSGKTATQGLTSPTSATSSSSPAGVRPFPAPTDVTTADDPTTEPSTGDDPTSTSQTSGDPTDTSESGSAASEAARAAAEGWVEAINSQSVSDAKERSCDRIQSHITADFVAAVNGSIKITSVTASGSAGTLKFTYKKTTDTARQADQLSLILEADGWKVCT